MKLLLLSPGADGESWRRMLGILMPEVELIVWSDGDAPRDDIDYMMVWKPPVGVIKHYKNLKAILSLGAGIDGILCDTELPAEIPIVRLVDRGLTEGMSEYMIYWTLHYHRHFGAYQQLTNNKIWREIPQTLTSECRVGIMGLGVLGTDSALKLSALGFDVAGWSRSPKTVENVESFHGVDGMVPFLNRTDILICLLPLTDDTAGMLGAEAFAALPKDAVLINAARGPHVVDEDLLDALDTGHLRGATLDVFHTEPLQADHPFWAHPKVIITPHMASQTLPESAAACIKKSIHSFENGEVPDNLLDRNKGY